MHRQAEVAIVGAGPVGIELAIALKKAGITYVQFDKGQAAQMIANFPPQTRFFSSSERISISGIPLQTIDQQKCFREEYLAYLRMIISHYQLEINTYEEVIKIQKERTHTFTLKTISGKGGRSYRTKAVVLATGGTAKPRMLGVPGEHLPHVSTKMEDPHRYFQQQTLIAGSKNSAVETALRCYNAGAKVVLAVRRERFDPEHVKYWLLPEIQGRIVHGEIQAFFGVRIAEILSDGVQLIPSENGDPFFVPANFVIKAIGFEADMSLFKQLGVPLSKEHEIPKFDPQTMETPIPGVFAMGTATGGTQIRFRIFIENCHDHVSKITSALCQRFGKAANFIFPNEIQIPPAHLEE
jgi:thioredoxin reductase (NADPH)